MRILSTRNNVTTTAKSCPNMTSDTFLQATLANKHAKLCPEAHLACVIGRHCLHFRIRNLRAPFQALSICVGLLRCLLVVARNPSKFLAHVDQHFKLKNGSVQSPTSYLGADVGKYSLPDGSEAWYLSSNSYVKETVRNVETWLQRREKDNSGWRSLKTKTS